MAKEAIKTNGNNVAKANNVATNEAKTGEILPVKYSFKALDNKAADTAIANIRKSGAELRKLAHETAVGILMHYEQHGDYTKIVPLSDAISEAMSRSMSRAFVEWVEAYSSLKWDKEEKTFTHNKRDRRIKKPNRGFFDTQGTVTEFFRMERDVAIPTYDEMKLLEDFVKRMGRLLKDATEGREVNGKVKKIKHKISPEMVHDLEAFAKNHGVTIQ